MKKNFIIVMLAAIVGINAFAQSDHSKMSPQGANENSATAFDQSTTGKADPVFKNEINIKAVRSFAKEYKNVQDAKWYKGDNWFAAYFTRNNVQVKVFYDSWGNYRYTLRSYMESELPQEVRHQVKSTHYDYNIYHINEVSMRGAIIYFIKLEGKNSWKDIRILDNEMESLREFSKAK